jgi:hypothetical protein
MTRCFRQPKVFWVFCHLFTVVKDPTFIEVLFISLHEPNYTHRTRLWADVEHFCQCLCEYTGTHIHVLRGYEPEGANSHEHGIVLVPKDEFSRFQSRLTSFKPYKAWNWTHQIEAFDPSRKDAAYRYALVKHTPVMPNESKEYFCPQRYHRCRNGKCSHIPAPNPAGSSR